MRVTVVAVGRAKRGPTETLWQDYARRLTWPVTLKEIDLRGGAEGPTRQRREAAQLLAAVPRGARLVALDERGEDLASAALAARLSDWRDRGIADLAFVIGGANGLDLTVRAAADLVLAFGRQTWPHMMARAMLIEQIYRAQQIILGHPYHRA